MSGLFFRHLQLPATSLPVQPAGLQRFLVAEFFMCCVCVCVCVFVWPTVVRQLTKIWWAYDFAELGGGGGVQSLNHQSSQKCRLHQIPVKKQVTSVGV